MPKACEFPIERGFAAGVAVTNTPSDLFEPILITSSSSEEPEHLKHEQMTDGTTVCQCIMEQVA